MVYDPIKNKFLTFNKGVSRTAKTDVVIAKLEKYFAEKKHYAKITSIYRSPEQQLQVIKDYIKQKGLDKEFPKIFDCNVKDKIQTGKQEYYKWQGAWSRLLNKGIIINPPFKAICLYDYIKNGV